MKNPLQDNIVHKIYFSRFAVLGKRILSRKHFLKSYILSEYNYLILRMFLYYNIQLGPKNCGHV